MDIRQVYWHTEDHHAMEEDPFAYCPLDGMVLPRGNVGRLPVDDDLSCLPEISGFDDMPKSSNHLQVYSYRLKFERETTRILGEHPGKTTVLL